MIYLLPIHSSLSVFLLQISLAEAERPNPSSCCRVRVRSQQTSWFGVRLQQSSRKSIQHQQQNSGKPPLLLPATASLGPSGQHRIGGRCLYSFPPISIQNLSPIVQSVTPFPMFMSRTYSTRRGPTFSPTPRAEPAPGFLKYWVGLPGTSFEDPRSVPCS